MSLRPASSGTATDRGKLLGGSSAFWSKRAGRPFSSEDAREATSNLCGFLSLLQEWEAKEAGRIPPEPNEDGDRDAAGET